MAPLRVHLDMARSYAHSGLWKECGVALRAARIIDPKVTAREFGSVIHPFLGSPAMAEKGVQLLEVLSQSWSGQWWIHERWAQLGRVLNRPHLVAQQTRIAQKLRGSQ